jgi:Ankyrin repeats (3 copies)
MLTRVAAKTGFTKSCGLVAAAWLALVGAYAYVAFGRIHEAAPAVAIGVLGGTFAAMLLSSFIGLFTGGRDRSAIRRAINGEAPRDGRLEAASGPIRALGQPLETPFTGQPCVAYDYDVKRAAQGASDFAGVALAPSAIDTPRGPARVLGWALLDQFPAAPDEDIDTARGTRYLSSAAMEPFGVTTILSTLGELVADDDGAIRKDFQIDADSVNLEGRRIRERSIPPGATVTILGYWSDARRGFAAVPPGINRLFAGDLRQTMREVGGDSVKTFAIAAAFFVALHALLAPMYIFAPGGGRSRAKTAASVWDERDCERQKVSLDAGADPNERGTDAMTPLINSARLGEPACVRQLIAAGARVEDTDKTGDTALTHAVVAGRDENIKILLEAGAKDFRVTAAAGRRIAETDAPFEAVREYIDALHRGDFHTMAGLMENASEQLMEERRADLPLWQSRQPKTFTLDEGWMTDNAATLTTRGPTQFGERRIVYHLERRPDGWMIRKEWFPDER